MYRPSAVRMACAGAMPRPLDAIFSISTVFSPVQFAHPFKLHDAEQACLSTKTMREDHWQVCSKGGHLLLKSEVTPYTS